MTATREAATHDREIPDLNMSNKLGVLERLWIRGTGGWFLKLPEFDAWVKGQSLPILWLFGIGIFVTSRFADK